MRIAFIGAAALFFAFSSFSAQAMPGNAGPLARPSDPAARHAQMDADGNGLVSWEEFTAARPSLNRNAFDRIDANSDGGICINEWQAFSSGHGGAAPAPDMGKMMGAMKGSMPSAKPQGAPGGMPLIMPPAEAPAMPKVPAMPGGMPLITPPAGK